VKGGEKDMQVVADSITKLIVGNLIPTLGAALVIMLAVRLLLSRVRSRGIRELGGMAGALLWFGWLAVYYKVV
jgi:hypothetical protein